MATHKMPVVQLGGHPVIEPTQLAPEFQWCYFPDRDRNSAMPQTLRTPAGYLNSFWRNALFLLPLDDANWRNLDLLKLLPANHILYDQAAQLDKQTQELLALKGAFALNMNSPVELTATINRDWFPGQDSFKLDHGSLRVLGTFTGTVHRFGRYHLQLAGNFGPTLQPVAIWETQGYASRNRDLIIQPEFKISPNVSIRYQLTLINQTTDQPLKTLTFNPADYPRGKTLHLTDTDYYYTLSLLAAGQGDLDIGLVHISRAREQFGRLFPGGQFHHVSESLNENFYTYFDAGDMRPPLNVYFSGFKMTDHFEGNFMMERLGAPFLLISDPRLNGGGFYVGSPAFEHQLLNTIQDTLHQLGFAANDLILSGISEGTVAAFYYGAQLHPRAIITGKPLINLGTMATNGRIKRTQDFQPSFDLLLYHTGDVTPTTAQQLNQRIWTRFKQGDFSQTTFAVAHMYQDDFDNTTFSELFDWVTTEFPHARFLHKGILGRHNDNTPAVNTWFIKQFRMILASEFKRHFADEEVMTT